MEGLRGCRALVTGASSGIGSAAARLLGRWGCDLTITARRAERLKELAAEIGAQHGVTVRCLACDLSDPHGPERLWQGLRQASDPIDILINCAGVGDYRPFFVSPWHRQAEMLQLNLVSLVDLSHRFLAEALARGRRAYLLNVASIGAFQPVPYFANYAATKAYVLSFTEALAAELKGSNVSVTCLCPGGTATEFADNAGMPLTRIARRTFLSPERVAEIGLAAMLRGRRVVVTGAINKLSVFLLRFAPRRVATYAAWRVLGKPAALRQKN